MQRRKDATKAGPYAHSGDNGRVTITAGDRPERPHGLITSTDPHDRAHVSMDQCGFLRPAAHDMDGLLAEPVVDTSIASRPRRYPEACCVNVVDGHGVPHDSMFDAWAEAARRLSRAGIEVGLGTAARADDPQCDDLIRLADMLGRDGLRSRLRRRLRQRITTDADRLEAARADVATRLIREAGALADLYRKKNVKSVGEGSAPTGTKNDVARPRQKGRQSQVIH